MNLLNLVYDFYTDKINYEQVCEQLDQLVPSFEKEELTDKQRAYAKSLLTEVAKEAFSLIKGWMKKFCENEYDYKSIKPLSEIEKFIEDKPEHFFTHRLKLMTFIVNNLTNCNRAKIVIDKKINNIDAYIKASKKTREFMSSNEIEFD